jgi:hypothetical protein
LKLAKFSDFYIVIFLTGIGHFISFIFFPIASSHIETSNLANIARFESYLVLLISILSFGVNSTATRDVALNENFIDVVKKVQSSRITLSLIISISSFFYGIISGFNLGVFVFCLAPIFALNFDFILYGIGKPLSAAVASFVRLSLPMILFLILIYLFELNSFIYIIITLFFYVFSVFLVAKSAKAPVFYPPRLNFFNSYLSSFSIGFTGLALAFLRPGYLPFLADHLNSREIIEFIYFSKFCLLAVAARRILIQYFYVWIANNLTKYQIDIFLIFVGLFVLATSFQFGVLLEIAGLETNLTDYFFVCCGAAFFSIMLSGTSDAKLILKSRDTVFLFIHIVPIFAGILIFLMIDFNKINVLLSLVFIEFCISLTCQFYIIYCKERNE